MIVDFIERFGFVMTQDDSQHDFPVICLLGFEHERDEKKPAEQDPFHGSISSVRSGKAQRERKAHLGASHSSSSSKRWLVDAMGDCPASGGEPLWRVRTTSRHSFERSIRPKSVAASGSPAMGIVK